MEGISALDYKLIQLEPFTVKPGENIRPLKPGLMQRIPDCGGQDQSVNGPLKSDESERVSLTHNEADYLPRW